LAGQLDLGHCVPVVAAGATGLAYLKSAKDGLFAGFRGGESTAFDPKPPMVRAKFASQIGDGPDVNVSPVEKLRRTSLLPSDAIGEVF